MDQKLNNNKVEFALLPNFMILDPLGVYNKFLFISEGQNICKN